MNKEYLQNILNTFFLSVPRLIHLSFCLLAPSPSVPQSISALLGLITN